MRAKPRFNRLGEGGEASFRGLSFDESVGSVRFTKMSADLDRLFPTASGDGGTPPDDGLGIGFALPCLAGGEARHGIADAKRAGLRPKAKPLPFSEADARRRQGVCPSIHPGRRNSNGSGPLKGAFDDSPPQPRLQTTSTTSPHHRPPISKKRDEIKKKTDDTAWRIQFEARDSHPPRQPPT